MYTLQYTDTPTTNIHDLLPTTNIHDRSRSSAGTCIHFNTPIPLPQIYMTAHLPQIYMTAHVLVLVHVYASIHRISGVVVSVLASSVVDCGFKPQSGQIKDYKIGICCFSAEHAALRRKSKD